MRRAIAIVLTFAATVAAIAVATGAGDSGGDYRVRAIFDNAAFVIPGEDVKIAGVRVGAVAAVDVTADNRAAVTLAIDDPGFQDFRTDARCTIRPQSLIGEKFVECSLTGPHPAGEALPAELRPIPAGRPGAGDRLLPVERTDTPVDLDLVNSAMRRPYTERLTIILNELGTGLAGRGAEVNEIIRRANPALRETGEVLALLARQNRALADLARDSDTVLAPLARERERVGSFIANAGDVAQATAERRRDLAAGVRALPAALREIRPTLARLSDFAASATPVLADLRPVAPDVSRFLRELGPFSRDAIPALDTLGDAARRGTPAVRDARPVVARLRALAGDLRPLGQTLAAVLESFRRNDGIERLADYLFFQVAAINGFDSLGHYLRASLIVNSCSNYTTIPVSGCEARFETDEPADADATAAAARAGAGGDRVLARTARVLAGEPAADVLGKRSRKRNERLTETALRAARGERVGADASSMLLDYLLGSD